MAPATRTNSTATEEILTSLRDPIAQLTREEMQKLREEMGTTAMEVTTSQLGRNQSDQRQNMQFTRVTKIEFPKFGGDDVKRWMYKCEQFFKVDNVPDEQTMVFDYKGKTLIIRGTTKPVVQWMNGKQAAKTGKQASNLAMCVYPTAMLNMLSASVPTTEFSGMPNTPSVLDPLIEEFDNVFEVPNCLPPKRGHDHKIPLKEGTQLINMRPYRHPPTQKDAIESMVKELLDSGVIRHSQSSFSSPVIRMFEDDIAKTAFKTYEGHYEFLAMPFGLTNAPSTFQALMNEVFRPFLRKFTLVFFDDILVYSPDMQSHVEHLRQILKVMREQQLYAKASKCTFGAQKVEYLGHIISGLGVSTDPHKIQAMKGHPIAFLGKTSAPKHQVLSTYEKEFLAVIQALEKWRGYLLDRHFVIKTDHYSLNDEALRKELMQHFHNGPTEGHSGMQATTKRMGALIFWKELFSLLQVQLHTSTAYHPQTDGQTEVINRSLKCHLRCMCGEKPKEWVNWIPLAVQHFISHSYHTTIKTTPYHVVYGQAPPDPITYTKGDNLVDVVDRSLSAREAAIDLLKFHIKRSQNKMKSLADKHRSDREFEEGVWVYLKLQPYRQATLRQGKQHKLSPKYFGPFLIMKKVGKVAYK
nr:Ty3/gypsy retrotransposon protein [Tanacetum cinerariifolium]